MYECVLVENRDELGLQIVCGLRNLGTGPGATCSGDAEWLAAARPGRIKLPTRDVRCQEVFCPLQGDQTDVYADLPALLRLVARDGPPG